MARDAVLKEFAFTVDLKKTLPLPRFEVVDGDTGCVLKVSVADGGDAVSLAGMFVTAVFASSAGTAVQDSMGGGITLDGSTAVIELRPASIAPGHVSCELQLYSSTEENPESKEDYDVLVTTARFGFDCRGSMLNADAIASLPETPLLISLLESVSEAEAERAAAEQLRVEVFEAMMALSGSGCIQGEGAPGSSIQAQTGMLYFDTDNERVYVCVDDSNGTTWNDLLFADGSGNELKVMRNATYNFADIPYGLPISLQSLLGRLGSWYTAINGKQNALTFDSTPTQNSSNPVTSGGVYAMQHADDWVTVSDSVLPEDVSSVTVNSYGSSFGTGGFRYDEMRLIMYGGMSSNAAVRLYVNGEQQKHIRFQLFAIVDPDDPGECCTVLTLSKPHNGFAYAERCFSGDSDDTGMAYSNAVHVGMIKLTGLTGYTSVRLVAENSSARIPSGTRIVLQGRNVE